MEVKYTKYDNREPLSQNQDIFTTQQAADLAGVHKNTVLNWIRKGKIQDTARDWKGYRVWSRDDVRRLLEYKTHCEQLNLNIQ